MFKQSETLAAIDNPQHTAMITGNHGKEQCIDYTV